MDLKTAARIKANARLKPAKDISVLYAALLANTNPDKFHEIRENLILAIDGAEAEYQILTNQIAVMSQLIPEWDHEIAFCGSDIQTLQAEINALDQEREEIEARVRTLSHLDSLKEQAVRANIDGLRADLERVQQENANTERDIASTEASNETRSVALSEVIAAFEKFLLRERPSGSLAELDG
jgi:chromosome segregation ATPase